MAGFAGGAEIARLYARISADTSEFSRAMGKADGALGKTSAALGTFVKVGVGAAVAGLGALGTGLYQSLKAAASFDKVMSGAKAVLGATSEEMGKLNKLALQLGKDTAYSAAEAATMIEMLGKNGVTATQILDGMAAASIDLAAATGADLATAADIATDAMQLFNISTEDMAKAVNGISGVTSSSKFDINDYALALANGGAVASKLGASFEDFNAVIAATASSFSSGQTAGTSFKVFMQRMVPQSEPAADAMRRLGLFTGLTGKEYEKTQEKIDKYREQLAKLDPTSKNYAKRAAELQSKISNLSAEMQTGRNAFFDAEGGLKGFDEIAGILQKSMAGLSDEMKSSLLFDIFGTEAAQMALALAGVGADGINAARGVIDAADASQQAATRLDNLAGDVEQASGSFDTLKIAIGQAFTPLARRGVQAVTAFLNRLMEIDFTPLAQSVEKFMDALLGRDFGTLATMFSDWAGHIWKFVQPKMLDFWIALVKWVNNPVLRGKVLKAVQRAWDTFTAWARGLWGQIVPALNAMWRALTQWSADPLKANALTAYGLLLTQGLWQWAKGLWGIVSKDLGELWKELTSWVTDPTKRSQLWNGAVDLFKSLWNWAADVWGQISPGLGAMWTSLTSWVTDSNKRSQLWDNIKSGWNWFWEWAGKVWGWMAPGLGDAWTSLTSWVTDPAKRQQLWNGIAGAWTAFWDWAGAVWGWMAPGLGAAWGWLISWVTDPQKRQQLWSGIVNTWTAFTEWAAAVWGWVSPILGNVWSNLTSWVTDPQKRSQLWAGIKNTWTAFTEWAGKVWDWAAPKLSQFWTDLTSWVTDPAKRQRLLSAIANAWTSFADWVAGVWNGQEGQEGLGAKLGKLWSNLTGWVTNPEKRAQLWASIKDTWTGFADWAKGIWEGEDGKGGIKAKLEEMFGNLNTWLDTNVPQLKPWKDAFVQFAKDAATQWEESFPKMKESVSKLKDSLAENLPAIAQLWGTFFSELFGGTDANGAGFVKLIEREIDSLSLALHSLVVEFRAISEYIVAVQRAAKAMWSGDWDELARQGQAMIDAWNRFRNSTSGWSSPIGTGATTGGGNTTGGGTPTRRPPSFDAPYEGVSAESDGVFWTWKNGRWEQVTGRARGGPVRAGETYLTGERGPELVTTGGNGHVYNADQTAAMLSGGRHITVDLNVTGESNLPNDRVKLRELARALMGELQLAGMRVT